MLNGAPPDLSAEDGTTIVELLVGLAMGMIVLAGLSMVLIVVLHGNARVDARVEATDNARVAMTRVMEELHSACVYPTFAPIQTGSTTETLVFVHNPFGSKSTVNQLPTMTRISYSAATGKLTQEDKTATGGIAPNWTWPTNYETSRILVSNVAPVRSGAAIFTYKRYENGELQPGEAHLTATPPTGLSATDAGSTIWVNVAFDASPRSEPVGDAGADTAIQNSATFRLTPPSYYDLTKAPPCM